MTRLEQLIKLNKLLFDDMPWFESQKDGFPLTEEGQWLLFRSLVNIREPEPMGDEFIKLQDAFLKEEIIRKGITNIFDLTPVHGEIYLWQGDITTLKVDAIVNAANSGMTGCYHPLHGCIDNAIHTFAGVELRLECHKLMKKQGFEEPTGKAKITKAYNLPSRHIIHTVGPIVLGEVTQEDCDLLADCYRSCVELADKEGLNSVAFCCISTGEFHFPNKKAAEIAIETIEKYKKETGSSIKIVFNVFKDEDYYIYKNLMV